MKTQGPTQAETEVINERCKQRLQYSDTHDDREGVNMLNAATAYLLKAIGRELRGIDSQPYPRGWDYRQLERSNTRQCLVRAAALIIADLDRRDRSHGGPILPINIEPPGRGI